VRIGFYHDDLPVAGRKPGGVSVLVHRLAVELVRAGHDLTMWTRGPAPADAIYRHVRLWPRLSHTHRLARMTLPPLLLNRLDTEAVDVLHLHGDDWFYVRRPAPTVRTLYGSALFEARHATSSRRRAYQAAIAGLELLSARLATATYGLGPGVPAAYPTVGRLDGGVDLPPVTVEDRAPRPTILFVGTWSGRKRGALLHRAFTEVVRPALPDAELWMVADHAEPAPGVTLLRGPSDAGLLERYRRAWVLCSPSSYEGLGLPYLEAMANGLPIVATPNPGARHCLGIPPAGRLVADDDLGPALLGLLRDAEARAALATAGRARAEHFAWPRVVADHVAAYEDAIQRASAARSGRGRSASRPARSSPHQ
jgi:phosphatidyl-myo-inositol alpha-mannosyltransferase